MNTNAYSDILKKNIKVLRKMGNKILILVLDIALTHVKNKAKEFYLKSGIEIIKWLSRSPNLNLIENI